MECNGVDWYVQTSNGVKMKESFFRKNVQKRKNITENKR